MSHNKRIIFLLPNSASKPVGGAKVVFEYANRLAGDGYDVNIVYAAYNRWCKFGVLHTLFYICQFIKQKVSGSYKPSRWFALDERIGQTLVWSLDRYHYPKDAQIIATAVDTSYYLNKYKIPADHKYYFIQDYENWFVSDRFVRETYHYPMTKIVISRWLKDIVEQEGEQCCFVPNGFDFRCFHLTVPPEQRDRYQIAFMYHTDQRKGIDTAFEAFTLVAKRHPEIHLAAFGAMDPPDTFPVAASYVKRPDASTFLRLYNESAIYVGASRTEGWGLTVGEAMQCGCAVACTDNKGYLEMAHDGENALVSLVGDAQALEENICRLIEDDTLRCRLARKGAETIHEFDIEKSYEKFKNVVCL